MAATIQQPASSNDNSDGLSSRIDLVVSLHLWAWPALTLAIQNAWGGSPQVSRDKRDWFAGAVSELLTSVPVQLHDVGDLEEVLLQVMADEFEVVVDDGSAEETAAKIWKGVERLRTGDASEVQELYRQWVEKQGKGEQKLNIARGQDQEAEDTDWDDDSEDDDEEWEGFADNKNADMDVDMGDAPPPQHQKQKIEPEIDDDGFTKVVGKKKNKR